MEREIDLATREACLDWARKKYRSCRLRMTTTLARFQVPANTHPQCLLHCNTLLPRRRKMLLKRKVPIHMGKRCNAVRINCFFINGIIISIPHAKFSIIRSCSIIRSTWEYEMEDDYVSLKSLSLPSIQKKILKYRFINYNSFVIFSSGVCDKTRTTSTI